MGSLKQRFHGLIAVCLELSTGPFVYALQKCDLIVLFTINPASLAKYRQAFTPNQANDDPTANREVHTLYVVPRQSLYDKYVFRSSLRFLDRYSHISQ